MTPYTVSGDVGRYNSGDDDNFSQVTNFWNNVLGVEERRRLAFNVGGHLQAAAPFIRERVLANFAKVHADFAKMIREAEGSGGKGASANL